MAEHLIDGEFQSDKYPTTPRGLVPLKLTDPMAQDLIKAYAQRRFVVDGPFTEDVIEGLRLKGFDGPSVDDEVARLRGAVWQLVERLQESERNADGILTNRNYCYGRINEIGRVLDPSVLDGVNLSPDAVLRWAKEKVEELGTLRTRLGNVEIIVGTLETDISFAAAEGGLEMDSARIVGPIAKKLRDALGGGA